MIKNETQRFFFESPLMKISGTPNGCFAVVTPDNVCSLHNAKGDLIVNVPNAQDGMLLEDGYYFIQSSQDDLWTMYTNSHKEMYKNIEQCEVYANNWYSFTKALSKATFLYNNEHLPIAHGFTQCIVFPNGYGIRSNAPYYAHPDWKLYTPQGEFICTTSNTEAILGNGLVIEIDHIKKQYRLTNPLDKGVNIENILDYRSFPNGNFVLTLANESSGSVSRFYGRDGYQTGACVKDVKFMPDGRFVSFKYNKPDALYRKNGIIETDNLWDVDIAGNYYLTNYENVFTLFNDQSESIGTGYCLFCWKDNFSIFEQIEDNSHFHLFNQNGKVFSFPRC